MSSPLRPGGGVVRLLALFCTVAPCGASQQQTTAAINISPDELWRFIEQAVSSQIQPLIAKLGSRMDALDSRLNTVDSRLHSLDSRLHALDSKQDGFASRLDELDRVDQLAARRSSQDSRPAGLVTRLDSQQSQLDGLASQLDNLDSRLNQLANNTDSLDSRLDQLANNTESLDSRLDELANNTNNTDSLQTPLNGTTSRQDRGSADTCSPTPPPPRDCSDLPAGVHSGIHLLRPGPARSHPPVPAYCDLETDGGGWTVIQRRADVQPRQTFYLGWAAYREGFGELKAEFWWGLEHLWQMTAPRDRRYELRINLEDFDGEQRHAAYHNFRISSEADGYRLSVANYTGNAGDGLSYHDGQKFSTKDKDNDLVHYSCAQKFNGAWWYKDCYRANLNGQYLSGPTANNSGINWNYWKGDMYSLKTVEMKIRPSKTV